MGVKDAGACGTITRSNERSCLAYKGVRRTKAIAVDGRKAFAGKVFF